jgi:hypothetical protein
MLKAIQAERDEIVKKRAVKRAEKERLAEEREKWKKDLM